jgi:hypothetical protein
MSPEADGPMPEAPVTGIGTIGFLTYPNEPKEHLRVS